MSRCEVMPNAERTEPRSRRKSRVSEKRGERGETDREREREKAESEEREAVRGRQRKRVGSGRKERKEW